MRRFVLWNAGIIFALIIALLGVLSTGWDIDDFDKNIGLMAHAGGAAIQHSYVGKSPEAIEAALRVQRGSEYPVRFIPADEVAALSPEFNVNSAEIDFRMREADEFLLIGVDRPEGALVIGPVPYKWPWSASYSAPLLAVVGLVALLASLGLTLPLVGRLRRLRRAADRIEAGDLTARIKVSAVGDEVDIVSRHFNAMAERIQEYVRRQEMLLQAVSHECRAPLSRMQFALELANSAASPRDSTRSLADCADALQDMQSVIDEVMLYTRFRSGPYVEHEELRIEEIVRAAIAQTRAPEHLAFVVELEAGAEIYADRRLFRRVVDNLLNNAAHHAEEIIRVTARVSKNDLWLVIANDGPPVPEADRTRIFEPFARVDRSRSRNTGGVGLGLAIVDTIVRAHGGVPEVQEPATGGVAFVTRWRRFGPDTSA